MNTPITVNAIQELEPAMTWFNVLALRAMSLDLGELWSLFQMLNLCFEITTSNKYL